MILHPLAERIKCSVKNTSFTENGNIITYTDLEDCTRIIVMDPVGRILNTRKITGTIKRMFAARNGHIYAATLPSANSTTMDVECSDGRTKKVNTYGGMVCFNQAGNVWEYPGCDCYYNGEFIQRLPFDDQLEVLFDSLTIYTKSGANIETYQWSSVDTRYNSLASFVLPSPQSDTALPARDTFISSFRGEITLWDVATGSPRKTIIPGPDLCAYRYFRCGYELICTKDGVLKLQDAEISIGPGLMDFEFKNGILLRHLDGDHIQTWSYEDAEARPSVLALFSSFGPPTTPLSRFIARDGDHALVTRVLSMLVPFAQ